MPSCHLMEALRRRGFEGELSDRLSERLPLSTDNSIYQLLPRSVVRPRSADDLSRVVRANLDQARPSSIVARGGGTGTNGQSLTEDLLLDCAALNQILNIDPKTRRARVQPGVVPAHLGRRLAPLGLMFPPQISTAGRATLGGMVATDAAGKGSTLYGRTGDHVSALRVVLSDGSDVWLRPTPLAEARRIARSSTALGRLYAQLLDLLWPARLTIQRHWPRDLGRRFTGYNLWQAVDDQEVFNPLPLICGSEGTLALVAEIELKLSPKPAATGLAVVTFGDLVEALEWASRCHEHRPAAVELLDETFLSLAPRAPSWAGLASVLPQAAGAWLVLELVDDSADAVKARLGSLGERLHVDRQRGEVLDFALLTDHDRQQALWSLRKEAVGLLAGGPEKARPTAFVEDCAVPPMHLPAFIREVRNLLDGAGLSYGIYGHADAGCVHVRPALDLTADPETGRRQVRRLTDACASLVAKYDGVLWGEHGRGLRGEYAEERLHPELYALMLGVKRAFDPEGRFNPTKLYPATDERPLTAIDQAPLRADRDHRAGDPLRVEFRHAFRCNGNAACHQLHADAVMCPSFQVSADVRQSPKGRADLLREWARQVSENQLDPELEADLKSSLDACLSCKACASQCPISVDIPELKSRFLRRFYQHRRRPIREHIPRLLDLVGPWLATHPALPNHPLFGAIADRALAGLGLDDLPRFSSPGLPDLLAARHARLWHLEDPRAFEGLGAGHVVLLADPFSAFFDAPSVIAVRDLIAALGYRPRVLFTGPTGKYEHVKGFRPGFDRAAERLIWRLHPWAPSGRLAEVPLIAPEPSLELMFEQEYRQWAADQHGLQVPRLTELSSWLLGAIPESRIPAADGVGPRARLFLHCSENAARPQAADAWKRVFRRYGVTLDKAQTGCCGMAGIFGHETEHQVTSRTLFHRTWRPAIDAASAHVALLAGGFSCRNQARRFGEREVVHPARFLLDLQPAP